MSSRPGIYNDIGKKARDILYRDYTQQPPIHYHYGGFDWSYYLSCQVSELVPGLRNIFKFFMPYQRFNRAEVQYLHDFAGITGGVSLAAQPLLNFSCVVGNSLLSAGADLSFDTATTKFAKCNAGFSFNSSILVASLALNDEGDTLSASCYRSVNPLTNTGIAAELSHGFFRNETSLTIGTQHAPFPFTLVKARMNTQGKVAALVQQKFLSTFLFTVAGELNIKDLRNTAKIGASLALIPQISINQTAAINLRFRPINICLSRQTSSSVTQPEIPNTFQ